MKNENVYFEFYFYNSEVSDKPLIFNEYTANEPFIYNIQNYNVCISNFNINISNLLNKNLIKRIIFFSNKAGCYENTSYSNKTIKKPILFSYYPSQTELSTQSILNYNSNFPFNHSIEMSGDIYNLDLQIKVEYSNNAEINIPISFGNYASVMLKFELKKDILYIK